MANARRNDIDWLRIGATLLLFPFHAARPFDHQPWHVKSADMSIGFDVFVWFVHQFHMPLFFALAGWSIERSLRRRTPAEVRRERYGRLLVPFLVGVALVSPPQAYVEAITQRGFDGTFLTYLPHFFGSLREFSWHHLWFLIYLFVFTMLYLPLFTRLRGALAKAPRPALLYRAIVPFAAVQLALRWRWPGYQNLYDDWANFAWYSLFFVGGFLLGKSPALEELVRRERWRCTWVFVLAIVGMLPLLAALEERIVVPGPGYLAYWPLNAAAGVCGVLAILGHGARLAAVEGVGFRYLREAAYPIYILHQTAIVVLGYWIVRTGSPVMVRYAILMAGGLFASFALYHFAIRAAPPLRLAFGMRLRAAARA
jgi:fucose 4-O-acetylase-like acetyltransferase